MGRQISDGKALDVEAPAGEEIVKGELYQIDGFTGFAMNSIDAAAVDRGFALERSEAIWSVKVPAGKCGTRGGYVKWTSTTLFQSADTDLLDEATVTTKTAASVAQVETVRNSGGFARLKLIL